MSYSNLKPGSEIEITDRIYFSREKDSIADLVKLTPEELERRKQASIVQEEAIYEKLSASTGEWASQAAETLRLMKAIEYVKTPTVIHTSNIWQTNEYDNHEISNMVYKMYWRVYEKTQWNRKTQKSEIIVWELSWYLYFNTPHNPDDTRTGRQIAGQERKRFTDKAAMEKYLQGRIAVYADLFTELSPPIPEEEQRRFCINGQLLPGYTIQVPDRTEPDKEAVAALLDFLEDGDVGGDSPGSEPELPPAEAASPKTPFKKSAKPNQKKSAPTR